MKNYLADYQVILWDFDGVILDSMTVRDEGFRRVLINYPEEEVEALLFYHRQNGGLSRYHKFRYFFEEIRREYVTEERIQELANDFSTIMLAQLNNPDLLIHESLNFIKEHHTKLPMHIVSGSDQTELRQLCRQLELSQYFKSIHGSPIPKKQLVNDLLNEHQYVPSKSILIGDSINDWEAANSSGVGFQAFGNAEISHLTNRKVL